MDEEQIEAQIRQESERAAKLMEGLARSCYEESVGRGDEENFKFETIGIITIVSWDKEDVSQEDVAYGFETRRHYVKTGILQDTLAAHLRRRSDDND